MSDNKKLTPICIIYVDDVRLDTIWEGRFRSVRITDPLSSIGSCSIDFICDDLNDMDTETFCLGSNISVNLGYKDDMHEAFNGQITGFPFSVSDSGCSRFTVKATSYLHQLNHGNRYRVFQDLSPSEIIEKIFLEYGFQVDIESFGPVKERFGEEGITDWNIVLLLANQYGRNIYCSGKRVYIKQQMTMHKRENIYEWGKSLIAFDIKMSAEHQAVGVKVVGWDQLKGKSFIGERALSDVKVKIGGTNDWRALSSRGGNPANIHTFVSHDVYDIAEAEDIAEARMRAESFSFLRGTGKAEGDAKLAAGSLVTIKGTGYSYDGEYIASEVEHDFSLNYGYATKFYLERNMIGDEAVAALNPGGNRTGAEYAPVPEEGEPEDDEKEEEDSPEFHNLRWEKDGKEPSKALVVPEEEASLLCEVKNIDEGSTVKFRIFEELENGSKGAFIAEVEGVVNGGEVEAPWEVAQIGDTGTRTSCCFIAEYSGIESEQSGILYVIHGRRLKDEDDDDEIEIYKRAATTVAASHSLDFRLGAMDFGKIIVVERGQTYHDVIDAAKHVEINVLSLPNGSVISVDDTDDIKGLIGEADGIALPDGTIYMYDSRPKQAGHDKNIWLALLAHEIHHHQQYQLHRDNGLNSIEDVFAQLVMEAGLHMTRDEDGILINVYANAKPPYWFLEYEAQQVQRQAGRDLGI